MVKGQTQTEMTAVLGAGIAGLSAAYYAINKTRLASVVLLEASNRVGGWIRSRSSPSGAIFEQGPRTIRLVGPGGVNTLNLLEDLQLTNKVIHFTPDHPVNQNKMIYMEKALHLLPMSLDGFFKTISLLDRPLINCVWTDLKARKVTMEDDSIYNFIERRIGQDVADNIVSAIVCGICAGDARQISVNLLFKNMFEAEQKYGSITKGTIARWLKKKLFKSKSRAAAAATTTAAEQDDEVISRSGLATRAKAEQWNIWSLQGGLEQLPQTLADNLASRGVTIHTGQRCERLTFKPDGVELLVNGNVRQCERVISSLPARNLAELLKEQHPVLATELKAIPMVTVAVANLEFRGDVLPLQAFGFLVPPKEKLPLLGVIFDSCVHTQQDSTVLTVMMGGAWFEEYFGSNPTEERLLRTAIDGVKNILCIDEEPVAHNIAVLKDCIPQYVVGHNGRVKRIHDYISAHGIPLGLCGSSYQGVGVNDVILSAKQAVRDIVK